MNESFLYYIWQFQYFNKKELRTTQGEKIEIFKAGILNTHAGPDFSHAAVRIDEMDWAGHVEIHTKSSDWFEHRHDSDQAYENVILHVVWHDDRAAYRSDHTLIPTLELKSRIDDSLIRQYKKLVHNPFSIPCRQSLPGVDSIVKLSMLDRTVVQRLEVKADQIIALLTQNKNDWEETAFHVLAGNFGFKVNHDAFLQLGRSIPYKVLLKHADKLVHLEALLFGQAGFLDITVGDDYYKILQREYHLLGRKYDLIKQKLARAQWRFLRLRPANFPTVRLAQFSALIHRQKNIFSRILEATSFRALEELFYVQPSEYWQNHYRFNKIAKHRPAELGDSSMHNLVINSVAPLLAAYGKFYNDPALIDRATAILQLIPAESNTIIKTWGDVGFVARTSFDSQALIELYNSFCRQRNCLTCNIGASLLKPKL